MDKSHSNVYELAKSCKWHTHKLCFVLLTKFSSDLCKLAHIFLCAAQVFILKRFAKNIIYFCLSPGWATLH